MGWMRQKGIQVVREKYWVAFISNQISLVGAVMFAMEGLSPHRAFEDWELAG